MTPAETKEYYKQYNINNREKLKETQKEYKEKNKEKVKAKQKEWRDNNKEKKKEYAKIYNEKNKDKIKEYNEKNKIKEYNKTNNGKKSYRIAQWKYKGVVCEDWNALYDLYVNCWKCERCECDLVEGNYGNNKRCLDHNHTTGLFRNVLCHRCNTIVGYLDAQHP
jgi:hypothetical protein